MRRGSEGVDAEIGIFHRAQLRLQQNILALTKGILHKYQRIAYKGGELFPVIHQLFKKLFHVQCWLMIEMLKKHILDSADLLQPVIKPFFIKELADLNSVFGILIRIEGGDAGFCGAKGMPAQPLLLILILKDMIGHQQLCTLRNENMGRGNAPLPQMLEFAEKAGYVQSHAVADDVGDMGIEYAGGKQVQCELAIVADDGMAGIGTALEADHNVGFFRKHVGNFPFALVAPVGANDCLDHKRFLLYFKTEFQSVRERNGKIWPPPKTEKLYTTILGLSRQKVSNK